MQRLLPGTPGLPRGPPRRRPRPPGGGLAGLKNNPSYELSLRSKIGRAKVLGVAPQSQSVKGDFSLKAKEIRHLQAFCHGKIIIFARNFLH
jgi:hypothetical protein